MRLPTAWIGRRGLLELEWGGEGKGANTIAALMSLISISHVAEDETGIARMTYTVLSDITGLSRAKVSGGLRILETNGLVERGSEGKSHFKLGSYGGAHKWGKLPARSMYSSGRIKAFSEFKLRQHAELDALKMFLLFVAFRGEDINAANISYASIEKYSGVRSSRIKGGISLLVSLDLIKVDQVHKIDEPGVRHTYRIVGVESRRHMGTSGRQDV